MMHGAGCKWVTGGGYGMRHFRDTGGLHMFYIRRVTDIVFRLTRETIGTEGWYRRLLCMHVSVEPQIDAGSGDVGDV